MRIEKTKSAVRNIAFGIVNKLLAIVFPFIIKTIIIYKLGVEYLGLNSLFTSILNVLNFAEIGFGTALVFSMYEPLANDDQETICALLNFYRKVYRVIGTIVVCVGIAIMPFLKYFISGNVPADINLYLLYIIYLFNNVFGYFFFSYKQSILLIHQRNDIVSNISTIVNTLTYSVQVLTLFCFKNYYAYIIFTPIATIINNLVIGFVTKKKYPQFECKGEISQKTKKDIKVKVVGLMCHKVGAIVQSSIDNIAISTAMGLVILGVYNNYVYVQTAINSFISLISYSIIASVANNIYKEDVEQNYKLFKRLSFANGCLITFCTCCMLCLYQPFMSIWDTINDPLSMTAVISMCLLFFVNNITNTIYIYREALGTWDKDKIRPLLITVINLIGTIISAVLGSIEGIILSTVIAIVSVGIYLGTKVLFDVYFKRSKKECFLNILMHAIVAIVVCSIVYFVVEHIVVYGIKTFILRAIVTVVLTVALIVVFFVWNKDFRYWFNKIKGLIFKKKSNKNVKES